MINRFPKQHTSTLGTEDFFVTLGNIQIKLVVSASASMAKFFRFITTLCSPTKPMEGHPIDTAIISTALSISSSVS